MNIHLEIIDIFYKFRNLHFLNFIPDGLTHSECFAIMKLKELEKNNDKQKITFSDLAKSLNVSVPALSRTIKHLEEKKYVIRIEDKLDKRNNILKVTKSGNDMVINIESKMKNYCTKIYKRFGKKKFNDFIKYLNDLYNISLDEIEKKEMENDQEEK